jgi:hypothetical protein
VTSKHTESEKNAKTQEIKSYLTHEISVLGKTVPTLSIAAVVMIGGASAAVLSSFGTVSGTADVQQAITFEDESPKFNFDTETQTAGERFIETKTLQSNANVSTSISLVSRQGQPNVKDLDKSEYTSTFSGTTEDFGPNDADIPYDLDVIHYADKTVWESNVEGALEVSRPFHVVRLEVNADQDGDTDIEKVVSGPDTTEISQPFISRERLPVGTDYEFKFTFENTRNDNPRYNLVPQSGGREDTVSDGASVEGIDTRVVEYYEDAGHDFSSYQDLVPEDPEITVNGESIDTAIGDAESGDTILVESGDYDPFVVDKSDLTVVAASAPSSESSADITGSANGIEIAESASGATVRGFNVDPSSNIGSSADDTTLDRRGILVKAQDVTVDSNYVHGVDAGDRAIGIYVYGHNGDNHAYNVSGTVVSNNLVEEVEATGPTGDDDAPKSSGTTITENSGTENSADGVSVTGNTVRAIGGSTTGTSAGVEVDGGNAQDFRITYNQISDIVTADASVPTGVYVTGYTNDEDDPSFGQNHKISFNNLLNTEETGGLEVGVFDVSAPNSKLNARNNYWGSDGSVTGRQLDAAIDSSFEDKFKSEIAAGQEDRFAVINDFAINLKPKDYTVETRAEPVVS